MSAIVVPRVRAMLILHPLSSGRTKPCVMLCKEDADNDVEVVVFRMKWRNDNNAANRIIDYLREARENRTSLFAVISHLLR